MNTICGAREFETNNWRELPDEAVSLGPNHAPTSHRESAYGMREALLDNGLSILHEQYVVDGVRNMKREGGNYGEITIPGAHLFALYKVRSAFFREGEEEQEFEWMVGYRNSVAQTMARRACIGVSFPICTNVSLFGEDIVFNRKNTTGQTDFARIAYEGVRDKVLPMFQTVQSQLDRLAYTPMTALERRSATLALFEHKVLPLKTLPTLTALWGEVERGARDEWGADLYPEVSANRFNQLGLMHSCTRVIQGAGLRREAEASQRISRHFGFGVAA